MPKPKSTSFVTLILLWLVYTCFMSLLITLIFITWLLFFILNVLTSCSLVWQVCFATQNYNFWLYGCLVKQVCQNVINKTRNTIFFPCLFGMLAFSMFLLCLFSLILLDNSYTMFTFFADIYCICLRQHFFGRGF